MQVASVRVVPPEERTNPDERIVELRGKRIEAMKFINKLEINKPFTVNNDYDGTIILDREK